MTCASCATRIERKLNRLDGVTATVNYATEKAKVTYPGDAHARRPGRHGRAGRVRRRAAAGRARGGTDADADDPARDAAAAADRVAPCSPCRWSRMAMVPALQFDYWQWLSLTLAAPVVVWGAWPFHRAAWTNLRHGAATMDTLVSLGTLAAFGWSLYALFFGTAGMPGMTHPFELTSSATDGAGNIYLEAAAGVTTFILAGRYVEGASKRRAGAALRALLELGAKDVAVLRDGVERRIPIDQLAVGDALRGPARARRSPPTAWSRRATRRSTRRC